MSKKGMQGANPTIDLTRGRFLIRLILFQITKAGLDA